MKKFVLLSATALLILLVCACNVDMSNNGKPDVDLNNHGNSKECDDSNYYITKEIYHEISSDYELLEYVSLDESIAVNTEEGDHLKLETIMKPSDAYLPGENIITKYVKIDEITSSEAIAVARVFISDNITYEIEVTTDFGTTIFSGLRMTEYETEMDGQWFSFSGKDQMPHYNLVPMEHSYYVPKLHEGFYYLYVGNQGVEILLNVSIRISSSSLSASIELLR